MACAQAGCLACSGPGEPSRYTARTLLAVERLLTQNPRIKDNLQIADKGSTCPLLGSSTVYNRKIVRILRLGWLASLAN